MQKGNFNLYDVVVTAKPIMSIYEQFMSSPSKPPKQLPSCAVKKSSVTIGALDHINEYSTEQGFQYQHPQSTKAHSSTLSVKNKLRSSNFDLGSGQTQYSTSSGLTHSFKPNNAYIVPQAVKDEQRATHFKMGFEENKKPRPSTANNYSEWRTIKAK